MWRQPHSKRHLGGGRHQSPAGSSRIARLSAGLVSAVLTLLQLRQEHLQRQFPFADLCIVMAIFRAANQRIEATVPLFGGEQAGYA